MGNFPTIPTTPMKAIRAKCVECSGESYKEVEVCPIKTCALYAFRFGRRPNTAKSKGKNVGF